jgi:hypothetical protein
MSFFTQSASAKKQVSRVQNYYGRNCENKIDLCENETCSFNGYCSVVNDSIGCVHVICLFSGSQCEITSKQKKIIATTISTSIIMAIAVLISYFAFFLFLNLTHHLSHLHKSKKKKTPSKPIHLVVMCPNPHTLFS